MALQIGIVGLPNVGKSTLFRALTKKAVSAENFPFCTIDPAVGVVAVPDSRLDALAKLSNSENVIPAAVEFVDIAGLVKGAHEGEGMGNEFLTNIRETDAIAQVVRLFENDDVHHVSGHIQPAEDVQTINVELALADLQTVTKRLDTLDREVRSGNKEAAVLQGAMQKMKEKLEAGLPARTADLSDVEKKVVKQLHLLTMKPMLYVLNKQSEGTNIDDLNDGRWEELQGVMTETSDSGYVFVDAGVEDELRDLDHSDKDEFRKQLGAAPDVSVDGLIKAGYRLLDLITFFTTGQAETRGWQITRGSTAPVAGTAIHNDFKEKFIKAEVVHCEELLEAGSYGVAREQGKVRTEGKEYVVKDGDVIIYKI